MHKKIGRSLVIDVMRCAMSKQTFYQILMEVELVRKILNCSSLRWEVLRDAQADNGVHTDQRVALVGSLLIIICRRCLLEQTCQLGG